MAGLDLKSFRALFDRQYLKVCNYIQVKTSCEWSECESIARKAFVSLWKRRESMNRERSPLSLLLEITRQQLLSDHGIPNSIKDTDVIVAKAISSDLDVSRLEWAIDQLDPGLREIFMLRKQKNYSTREIAEVLDTSIQSVEEHLRAALVKLRSLLLDTMAPDQGAYLDFLRQG